MNVLRILINSYPRVEWKDFKYYYYLQNYENYRTKTEHLFYMYSFSANPKFKDPMGSLNFSRIDNAQLVDAALKKSPDVVGIFAPYDELTKGTVSGIESNNLQASIKAYGIDISNADIHEKQNAFKYVIGVSSIIVFLCGIIVYSFLRVEISDDEKIGDFNNMKKLLKSKSIFLISIIILSA